MNHSHRRPAARRPAPLVAERLEPRQLLSAALTVSSSLMVFNAVTTHTSQVETLTLTNTGDAALSLTGASIVADPTHTADGSARFAVTNASSLPSTLAAGASFALTVDYTATAVGLDYALLDLASSSTPSPTAVELHGIGTAGEGGQYQPSLERILLAYDEPNYDQVGETDITSAYYPEPPAANDSEVDLQQMVKAGGGDVTISVLASFVGYAPTPLHLGWYATGDVADTKQELFHTDVSDYQSVYVQPIGSTSFDPGTAAFGFYNPSQTVKVNGALVTGYTQDALNTYDTTDARKFRFFPLENADGSAVANSYIMTSTEWPSPAGYDFTNIVAVVTNVKQATPTAAPDAAAAAPGTATSIDVLANDAATTGTLTPSSVTVVTAPASGGTATVDATTGAITYTAPAGFTGTDAFAYTVANAAGYTSAPATVTVTVKAAATAGGIVTRPTTATAVAGVPLTVDVLSADTDASASLVPGSVTIASAPDHGGTATANADGTVTYTAATGYAGTEAFTYTVADSDGSVSSATAVTVTVASPAAAPVTADATVTTIAATTINVAASTVTSVGLDLATLALAAEPAHGTATVAAGGTITYTPAAGFVGADSLSYTVQDTAGHTSNVATVNLAVGVAIGTVSGDDRSLTLPQNGTTATVTLNRGTVEVFFAGTGALTVDKAGHATVAGSGLSLSSLVLSGTTAASTLTLAARGGLTVGGITDAAVLGRLVAPTATLTGTATLDGLSSLQIAGASGATLTIGSGVAAGASLTMGTVADSTLASAAPIKLLKATAWTSTGTSAVTAPSIRSLSVSGAFQPAVTLTAAGTVLAAATIGGPLGPGAWSLAGGIGTVNVRGGIADSAITAAAARSIRVTGDVTDATLAFTGAGTSLGALAVTGSIVGSTLTTAGDIGTLTAAALTGDTVRAGVATAATFADVTAATVGSATINAVRLKVRPATASFSDTTLIAHTLSTVALGNPATDDGGVTDGLAFVATRSVTGTAGGRAFRVSPVTAATQTFGDLQIRRLAD